MAISSSIASSSWSLSLRMWLMYMPPHCGRGLGQRDQLGRLGVESGGVDERAADAHRALVHGEADVVLHRLQAARASGRRRLRRDGRSGPSSRRRSWRCWARSRASPSWRDIGRACANRSAYLMSPWRSVSRRTISSLYGPIELPSPMTSSVTPWRMSLSPAPSSIRLSVGPAQHVDEARRDGEALGVDGLLRRAVDARRDGDDAVAA